MASPTHRLGVQTFPLSWGCSVFRCAVREVVMMGGRSRMSFDICCKTESVLNCGKVHPFLLSPCSSGFPSHWSVRALLRVVWLQANGRSRGVRFRQVALHGCQPVHPLPSLSYSLPFSSRYPSLCPPVSLCLSRHRPPPRWVVWLQASGLWSIARRV